MKHLRMLLIVISGVAVLVGCSDNGPAHAENVTAQIQNMKPEDRFELIKTNTGMSIQMKDAAIDGLPVSEDQKKAWKDEIRQSGGTTNATR